LRRRRLRCEAEEEGKGRKRFCVEACQNPEWVSYLHPELLESVLLGNGNWYARVILFYYRAPRPALLIPASPVIRTLARRWTPTYIPPQTPTYYIHKLCFYKHQFVYMIYINKKLWSKKLCQNKINFIYSRFINKTFSQLMHINFFVWQYIRINFCLTRSYAITLLLTTSCVDNFSVTTSYAHNFDPDDELCT
jgi:hypothetical protein